VALRDFITHIYKLGTITKNDTMKKHLIIIMLLLTILSLSSQNSKQKTISSKVVISEKAYITAKPINEIENYSSKETERLYQLTNDRLNNYLTFTGIISAIFGLIIALAGIYIGFASLKAQKRNDAAIKTLEEAKNYVSGKKTEFDGLMNQKISELEGEYQRIIKIFKDKLLADIDFETSKVKAVVEKKSKEIENFSVQENTSKTIEVLEKRLEFFENIGIPDDPQILLSKAKILREKEMHEEAITLLDKILTSEPNNINAHWNLGYEYSLLNNSEKTIFHYKKVIELNPKHSSALNNLGVELTKIEKNLDALENYEKAIEIEPNSILYYGNKISVLKKLNSSEKVINAYDKLISLDSKNSKNYEEVIKYLNSIDRKTDTIKYFDQALEETVDAKKIETFKFGKAVQFKTIKRFDDAIESFQKLIDENVNVEKCYLNIADIKNELGKTTEAIEILDNAILSSPLNASLYIHKAYFESKHSEEFALETIKRGSEQIQGEDYFFTCGRFFNEKRNYEFGIKCYQNALEIIKLKLVKKEEGNILNYYESLIITNDNKNDIETFKAENEEFITSEYYQIIFHFLNSCFDLKINPKKTSRETILESFKNLNIESKDYKSSWNFSDILIAIEPKMNSESYNFITEVSKYISKEITFQELSKFV
jgi:tetratricopeptide (TPR) repeat protein